MSIREQLARWLCPSVVRLAEARGWHDGHAQGMADEREIAGRAAAVARAPEPAPAPIAPHPARFAAAGDEGEPGADNRIADEYDALIAYEWSGMPLAMNTTRARVRALQRDPRVRPAMIRAVIEGNVEVIE